MDMENGKNRYEGSALGHVSFNDENDYPLAADATGSGDPDWEAQYGPLIRELKNRTAHCNDEAGDDYQSPGVPLDGIH